MTKEIDVELVVSLVLEINDRLKLITKIFPKEQELLLHHIASAAIHVTFFMKDLAFRKKNLNDKDSDDEKMEELYEKFLESCGCSDRKKNEQK